jgi:DnaJ-class molecular chaperone
MDYYSILDIHTNSTLRHIKKKYHKLALRWHPDKNNNSEESTRKFKEIAEAYQVLSNTSNRYDYDKFGRVPNNFKSPKELFGELFANCDPIIKKFLTNTFSKISEDFTKNHYTDIWTIFDTLDKDQIIEDSGDVVKHLLKKTIAPNIPSIKEDYTYTLELNATDLDEENEINITIDCLRKFTHIKLIIVNNTFRQVYILALEYNEHILEFEKTTYSFFLKETFPPGYKRINKCDLILEYDLHSRYIESGCKLYYPYQTNRPLEVNIHFKYNSNIIKITGKGFLKKKFTYGDLYIIVKFVYNYSTLTEELPKDMIPNYNNIDLVELIRKK